MDIKQITALGVAEDIAAKIAELSSAELAEANEKTAAAEKKLEASETSVKELSEKLKSFDGVDVGKLKDELTGWEKKYSEDMAAARLESAVELALTKAGAKDVALAAHLIDRSVIKEDGGKLMGISEQLEKIMSEKAWLFGGEETAGATVSTGMSHNTPPADTVPDTIEGALKEHFSTN